MGENKIAPMPSQLEKMAGCLSGVMIGDAMGMPWETMSRKEIMLATRKKGVLGFSKPVQTKIIDTMSLQAGQYTDDWQLTRAVLLSLIRSHGFDLMDCVKAHLTELETSECGFGPNTEKNLWVLKKYAEVGRTLGRNIPVLPQGAELQGKGTSNGVAMKIAPLALYFHDQPEAMFDTIKKLASITHKDPQAFLAAHLVARVISRIFNEPIGFCSKPELKTQIAFLVSNLMAEIQIRESAMFGNRFGAVHYKMTKLIELVNNGKIADAEIVAETLGTGCHSAQSIPFSIAMFLRHPTDFRAAVIETINCGGDTDTNASMVGAMAGANLGAWAIPKEWREFRPEYCEAGQLAVGLMQVMDLPG